LYDRRNFEEAQNNVDTTDIEMVVTKQTGGSGGGGQMNVTMNKGLSPVQTNLSCF
jgi:hypothetical protein